MPVIAATPRNLLVHPAVNLNGTSRQALCRDYHNAWDALQAAAAALDGTSPHGRDYQTVADPGVFRRAVEQHRARIDALAAVSQEIRSLWEEVAG